MDEAITGSPGFSPIAPDDQAGNLWILTILALIYTSMVAAARVYIKQRMYGLDDVLIGFSIVSPSKTNSEGSHSSLFDTSVAAFRPVYCRLCWPRQRPRQVQLNHTTNIMGCLIEGSSLAKAAFHRF
jgi:hypothetical protein